MEDMTPNMEQPTDVTPDEGESQEPEWASVEVEVSPGKTMKIGDVLKSYPEAERKMHEATTATADQKREIENQYKWATDLQTRYHSDPEFAKAFDEAYGAGQAAGNHEPQRSVLDPVQRRLDDQAMELQKVKFKLDFDRMRQNGYEVSSANESEILQYIQNGGVGDVESAYKILYFEKEVERRAEAARAGATEEVVNANTAYPRPPKGRTTKPSKDIRQMKPAERDNAVREALGKMDMFSE